jgi:SAM-dependent methyltransferase
LSVELFGRSLALPDFPQDSSIRGIGMTDWDGYAIPLAKRVCYTNTFLHTEPVFDVTVLPDDYREAFDFVIASDVFEHVAPPVSVAFANVRKMLKPGGVFVLTVPYGKGPSTVEHFPDLWEYHIMEVNGRPGLRNTTKEGTLQEFDNLVFHGGPGANLELRSFSEAGLMEEFSRAGYTDVKVYREPDFFHGVYWYEDWSLPIAARK